MNNKQFKEVIELSLPINSTYVASARLTASSIAHRMNFHLDEIEDIKTAVSEICIFIIKKAPHDTTDTFKISFKLMQDSMDVEFEIKNGIVVDVAEEDMSIIMIKALTDEMSVSSEANGTTSWVITKNHKPSTF